MTREELDEFLQGERTCRLATVGEDGSPHNSPLWFVWDGSALWLKSLIRSQRWVNVERNPRVSVVIDTGHAFAALRGVELIGEALAVGEVPRVGEPNGDLEIPERLFGEKYADGEFHVDGRHAWLRLVPDRVVSWDFRKMSRAAI